MVCRREQGFGALDRLHRPDEFAAVMDGRGRARGGCFEVRWRTRQSVILGSGTVGARFGLIVPKRFAKHAVLRNLLKRLARESFRNAIRTLPQVDIVLRLVAVPLPAGQRVDAARRRSWRQDVDGLLRKVSR
ncbi:MAG: ribonuclease P protein component [Gammaproteobacteria bacterium]|nr:ribonuclease P protein component [Gammaproteobacteria bacterium]MBU1415986.1 ribonuclease P protein component [Gammaproteobacteria bacterium]